MLFDFSSIIAVIQGKISHPAKSTIDFFLTIFINPDNLITEKIHLERVFSTVQ